MLRPVPSLGRTRARLCPGWAHRRKRDNTAVGPCVKCTAEPGPASRLRGSGFWAWAGVLPMRGTPPATRCTTTTIPEHAVSEESGRRRGRLPPTLRVWSCSRPPSPKRLRLARNRVSAVQMAQLTINPLPHEGAGPNPPPLLFPLSGRAEECRQRRRRNRVQPLFAANETEQCQPKGALRREGSDHCSDATQGSCPASPRCPGRRATRLKAVIGAGIHRSCTIARSRQGVLGSRRLGTSSRCADTTVH